MGGAEWRLITKGAKYSALHLDLRTNLTFLGLALLDGRLDCIVEMKRAKTVPTLQELATTIM
jgi:hypothetical protein